MSCTYVVDVRSTDSGGVWEEFLCLLIGLDPCTQIGALNFIRNKLVIEV